MDPWTIIGWGIIVIVALVVGLPILFSTISVLCKLALHFRTRKTEPAAGQVWIQGTSRLRIKRIVDTNETGRRIVMECGAASWSDSPQEWRDRVKSRLLYLEVK